MTMTISGSSGLIFPDGSGQETGIGRNRIINGDMRIDQRNAGASVTPANGAYTLDRWYVAQTAGASKFSVQQVSANANTSQGFDQSLRVTSLSAYSVAATDQYAIRQMIEGYNVTDLAYGTAGAKTTTLSFWVYSSLTGTFGGSLHNQANNKSYVFSYTISAANTWEQKSITIIGDTATALASTNSAALLINLSIGYGSTYSTSFTGTWVSGFYGSVTGATSVVGTNGATFYITGVQLEVGSTATPFERRMYGQELALCQRYYYLHASNTQLIGIGYNYSASIATAICHFPVTMRTTPVLSATSGTNFYSFARNGASDTFNSFALGAASPTSASMDNSSEISGTAGQSGQMVCNNASASIAFSAEL